MQARILPGRGRGARRRTEDRGRVSLVLTRRSSSGRSRSKSSMMPCIVSWGEWPTRTTSATLTTPLSVSTPGQTTPLPGSSKRTSFTMRSSRDVSVGSPSSRLELQILVGSGVSVVRDQAQPGLRHPRSHTVQEGGLEERSEHRLLVHELLDPVEDGLALLAVRLGGLLAEEPVDVGVAAVGVHALADHEGLDASGGVAEGGAALAMEVLELLLLIRLDDGGPLHRSQLDADTYGPQGVADELGDGGVHQVRRDLAGIEAVRVACLREEPLRLLRIIGIERRGPDELEGDRNDAPRDLREAEVLRLIDGLAIDGVVGRQPHAPIRPGGLGVPLVDEDDPFRERAPRGLEGEARRPADFFGELSADRVGDVGLSALEHGPPGGFVHNRLEDQAPHARGFAPVLLVRRA